MPVFVKDRDDQNYRHYEAGRGRSVATHAIQQEEAKAEGGWDVEKPEGGYGSADEYPDIESVVGDQSPPPPSSPPLPAPRIAGQGHLSHSEPPARTPSPVNAPQNTQYGTPVKSVSTSNLFAEDPVPLWDDEAPSISFVGARGVLPHQLPNRAVATAADTSRRHSNRYRELR